MQTHWIIDRTDGEQAVLIRGDRVVTVPRSALPAGARAGDALLPGPEGGYVPDEAYTARLRAQAQQRLEALLRREVR